MKCSKARPTLAGKSASITAQPGLFPRLKRNQSILIGIAFVLCALSASSVGAQEASGHQVLPPYRTNATFAFTADVHVTFNGYDDHLGIEQEINGGNFPLLFSLIFNETLSAPGSANPTHDGCMAKLNGVVVYPMVKDLCNQIQLVRKLNHLDLNSWNSTSFTQSGHTATLASAGLPITQPRALIIGGDLTDCGGGSLPTTNGFHSESCAFPYQTYFVTPECPYGSFFFGCGIPGQQLTMIEQIFDRNSGLSFTPLANYPVIAGLKNPDSDIPLKFDLYPGLGNHDLGHDKSGDMMDYIRNWTSSQSSASGRRVTNNDPYSGDYSWDWGQLHILNVGVYAGSGNQSEADDTNYQFNQPTMDWIKADLKKYASDGRPVIIAQHFGFDPLSWSTSWYLGANHVQGANELWPMLAPYNVIGLFHGHQHAEQIFTFGPDDLYFGSTRMPSGRVPYDIFESGPGFHQEFMLARVTDKFMDVEAAMPGSDFDNTGSNVDFSDFFTKRLIPSPTLGKASNIESGDTIATSFQQKADSFIVGSNPTGSYVIRRADSVQASIVAKGQFAVSPRFLTAYNLGSRSYVLVSDGTSLVSYLFSAGSNGLHQVWNTSLPLTAMAVVYGPDGAPSLLTAGDLNGRVVFNVQVPGTSGITDGPQFFPGGTPSNFAQMIAVPTKAGFTVVRYLASGRAEIYLGEFGASGISLSAGDAEQWGVDDIATNYGRSTVLIQAVTLPDSTSAILVKACPLIIRKYGMDTITQVNDLDSRYVVRVLTQDQKGTQIAWRGSLTAAEAWESFSPSAIAALPPVEGASQVGVYTAKGSLYRINLMP